MSLDVPPSDPPTLQSVDPNQSEDATVEGDDFRRADLQRFLREGAWEETFERWAATADLGEAEWEIVLDLELIERFDFVWEFNATPRRVSHSKSGRSSGASYSVSHSM